MQVSAERAHAARASEEQREAQAGLLLQQQRNQVEQQAIDLERQRMDLDAQRRAIASSAVSGRPSAPSFGRPSVPSFQGGPSVQSFQGGPSAPSFRGGASVGGGGASAPSFGASYAPSPQSQQHSHAPLRSALRQADPVQQWLDDTPTPPGHARSHLVN